MQRIIIVLVALDALWVLGQRQEAALLAVVRLSFMAAVRKSGSWSSGSASTAHLSMG